MAAWSPDPREANCVRHIRKGQHVFRDRNFWRDGITRCVYCFRAKGKRYKARIA